MRSRRWWLRALVPPVLVAAVISSVALANNAPASAQPVLTAKTPDQLLAMIKQADVAGVRGTVAEQAALGLPSVPSGPASGSATGLLGLLTGKHTTRIWENRQGDLRAQILAPLDETQIVATASELWVYTYSTNSATVLKLPDRRAAEQPTEDHTPPVSPDRAAKRLLSAISASTVVSVPATSTVAGRDAYVLQVEPRTADTTVGRITVDVDAGTGVPLRVEVFARGATSPAISVGFSTVSFGAIAPSVFAFTPPPGATVTRSSIPEATSADSVDGLAAGASNAVADAYTVGTGWGTVLVLAQPPVGLRDDATVAAMGKRVPGGTLISTSLVNALLTDEGRLLIGAVPAAALQAALAQSPPAK